jgi:error-prone DNA polymerase
VIEVAIVRPGPIQGDMVHPYLRRRMNKEKVVYPSPELEQVLGKTLGVPLFQEQAMKIAIVAAGFSPAEADQLRRAMATFKRAGLVSGFRDKMISGMAARGYPQDFAERCFRQIEGFGTYGFPESHAASFALLVYASAWLKCRYPDVFACALLNSQPMGFYAPAQILRDAREHGIEAREVDINASDWDCTLEPAQESGRLHARHESMAQDILGRRALRLGFRQIKGGAEADMRLLAAQRGAGYDSVRDLWLRTGLPPSTLEKLAHADAFASLGLTRCEALWAVAGLNRAGDKDDLPLLRALAFAPLEPDAKLPPMPPGEEVIEDYRALSLSLKGHPVGFLRMSLAERGILPCAALARSNAPLTPRVTVAGLVLMRQRPGTAKGVIFMTIEDETGAANVIIWPKLFEKQRAEVLGSRLVAVTGDVQRESGVIHLIARKVEDISDDLRKIERARAATPKARNFH